VCDHSFGQEFAEYPAQDAGRRGRKEMVSVTDATSDQPWFSCPACVNVDNTSGVFHNM
jgi:hypothetical protein